MILRVNNIAAMSYCLHSNQIMKEGGDNKADKSKKWVLVL
jgi:hypothetical protein